MDNNNNNNNIKTQTMARELHNNKQKYHWANKSASSEQTVNQEVVNHAQEFINKLDNNHTYKIINQEKDIKRNQKVTIQQMGTHAQYMTIVGEEEILGQTGQVVQEQQVPAETGEMVTVLDRIVDLNIL